MDTGRATRTRLTTALRTLLHKLPLVVVALALGACAQAPTTASDPGPAATAPAPTGPATATPGAAPTCEATSLQVTNDTAGTEFASLTTEGGTTTFEAYQIAISAPGGTEQLASSSVATDAMFDTGPLGPGVYSLSAIPVEQGGALNLGLIYSGDVTLSCEDTGTASLVDFLSSTDPVAEDGGAS